MRYLVLPLVQAGPNNGTAIVVGATQDNSALNGRDELLDLSEAAAMELVGKSPVREGQADTSPFDPSIEEGHDSSARCRRER